MRAAVAFVSLALGACSADLPTFVTGDEVDAGSDADVVPGSPAITDFFIDAEAVVPGVRVRLSPDIEVSLRCEALDPDDDELTYSWSFSGGTGGASTSADNTWTLPDSEQQLTVTCTVSDGLLTDSITIDVDVLVPSLAVGWRFNGDGADIDDEGHNIDVAFRTGYAVDRFGVANGAAFADADDGLGKVFDAVPSTESFSFGEMTIVTFVDIDPLNADRGIVGKGQAGDAFGPYSLGIVEDDAGSNAGHARFTWGAGGVAHTAYSSYPIPTNGFLMIAVVRTATSVNFYVDGTAEDQVPYSGAVVTNSVLINVGWDGLGIPETLFHGALDELRIYDRALSTPELDAIMTGARFE